MTSWQIRLGIGLAVFATTIPSTVSLAAPKSTVAPSDSSVVQGDPFTVNVRTTARLARCKVSLVGETRQSLGTIQVMLGFGYKLIQSDALPIGSYRLEAQCTKEPAVLSKRFNIVARPTNAVAPRGASSIGDGMQGVRQQVQALIEEFQRLDVALEVITTGGNFSIFGASVESNLRPLYSQLLAGPVPVANAHEYSSLLLVLIRDVDLLAGALKSVDRSESIKRYRELRTQTSILTGIINIGLGSDYRFPTPLDWINWEPPPAPTSTVTPIPTVTATPSLPNSAPTAMPSPTPIATQTEPAAAYWVEPSAYIGSTAASSLTYDWTGYEAPAFALGPFISCTVLDANKATVTGTITVTGGDFWGMARLVSPIRMWRIKPGQQMSITFSATAYPSTRGGSWATAYLNTQGVVGYLDTYPFNWQSSDWRGLTRREVRYSVPIPAGTAFDLTRTCL